MIEEEMENLNRPITCKEIEVFNKNLSQRKAQAWMASLMKSTKCLKKQ